MSSFLKPVQPQGIYKTLYAFHKIFGSAMGSNNTSPWTQGSPLISQIPGGPKPIELIKINSSDLSYPKSWGHPKLRSKIADYYNYYYKSKISMENVMVFAGGRPGLLAVLMFLSKDITVRVPSTEYTPYYDILEFLKVKYSLVNSTEDNLFSPSVEELLGEKGKDRQLVFLSNPSNPTGITKRGEELKELVERASFGKSGLLIDEAYELISSPPCSAMRYIKNIDDSNIFVCGAATKGLQAPGIRLGWVVSSKKNIEILGNFSSFGIGGVSRLSQIYAEELLERGRTDLAHYAIPKFYDEAVEYNARPEDVVQNLVDQKFGIGYFDNVGSTPAQRGSAREFLLEALKKENPNQTNFADVVEAVDVKYITEGGGGLAGDPLTIVNKYFGPRIAEMVPSGASSEEIAIFTDRVLNNVVDANGLRPG
ncbi:MAG: hypothetical protein CBC68_00910, partial [Candidatus Marinimicrobia bacterium TMED108]